jgi:hypothetical protein
MIHGYDDQQAPGMCVYGPYYAREKRNSSTAWWPARMSIDDTMYVNKIRRALGFQPPLANADIDIKKEHLDLSNVPEKRWKIEEGTEYKFLYSDSFRNARPYEGEWSLQLRDMEIWSADIELQTGVEDGETYHYFDEGVRGGDPERPYEERAAYWIGKLDPVFANFTGLLGEFPWNIK